MFAPEDLPRPLGRLTLLERLGTGGAGAVYRALDRHRDEPVAVKILSDAGVTTGLKKEFRRAIGLTHPNVVFPLDLIEDGGVTCYTMRLIEGVDFITAVRPAGRLDVDRLRRALSEVVGGLSALHAVGLVHGDLKPKNVLVTEERGAVLVDLGHGKSSSEAVHERIGTLVYAAPEVMLDGTPTVAGDWYSLGVMLFEALTGSLPFEAHNVPVMGVEKQGPPPAPTSGPPELVALVTRLLDPDPARRGDGHACADALGELPRVQPAQITGELVFVDRVDELARVLGAVERAGGGAPVVVHLTGRSGIGKSRLLERVEDTLHQRPKTRVLRAVCHRRDRLPLRAIEVCVEQLASLLEVEKPGWWRALSATERLACAQLFPALVQRARDEVAADALALYDAAPASERRMWAFAALRRAFREAAQGGTVVVMLDDLQWGDELSARALREILDARTPLPLAVVLAYRGEDAVGEHTFLQHLLDWEPAKQRPIDVVDVRLEPLPATHAIALGLALGVAPDVADSVAAASAGSPFLIELLTRRHRQGLRSDDGASVEAILAREIDELDHDERRLLVACALASRPLSTADLGAVTGLGAIAVDRALTRLENLRLVRTRGETNVEVDPYHDAVARAVTQGLEPGEATSWHVALGRLALDRRPPDEATAAVHFAAAGELERASPLARSAAAAALGKLAFDDAIRLYRLELECDARLSTGRRHEILEALASAAAAAGRLREAARALVATLEIGTPSPEAIDEVHERAGAWLLQIGLVEEGLAMTSSLRARLGIEVPRTNLGVKAALLWAYLGVTRRVGRALPTSVVPSAVARRNRFELDLGLGLASFDQLGGSLFILRATRAALRVGDRRTSAIGTCYLGALVAYDGHARAVAKGRALVARGRALIDADADPRALVFADLADAMATFCEGSFAASVEGFDRVSDDVATRVRDAVWDRMVAETTGLYALQNVGQLDLIAERIPAMRSRAEDSGDLALAVESELFSSIVLLAQDRAEQVEDTIRSALERWTVSGFSSQHWHALRMRAYRDLYVGPAPERLAAFIDGCKQTKRAGTMSVQLVRVEALTLEGRLRLALAEAGRVPLDGRRLGRIVARLRAERRDYADARAELLTAGSTSLAGDRGAARAALVRAVGIAGASGLRLEQALAARLLAILDGVPPPDDATAYIIQTGIMRPDRWLAVMAPGVRSET